MINREVLTWMNALRLTQIIDCWLNNVKIIITCHIKHIEFSIFSKENYKQAVSSECSKDCLKFKNNKIGLEFKCFCHGYYLNGEFLIISLSTYWYKTISKLQRQLLKKCDVPLMLIKRGDITCLMTYRMKHMYYVIMYMYC